MILAVDVFYEQNRAKIVGLVFNQWTDATYARKIEKYRHDIAEYEPGAFYKRELPCIMDILADLDLTQLKYIIVDGYVFLDDEGKSGLGAHLYEALPIKVPVIGVAKTSFANNKKYVAEVFRGTSQKPLFITAMGEDLIKAAAMVKSMSGDYRFPTMLKELDNFTKSDMVIAE
ncbi:endonuclease V [Emticicia agri]|uniref:Endonuclease V n=1 Tax=Emticicia agri TaxID=2492393 RepID=A0A4Q5M386_9BACT|nr:endonuclease V [Emticicia agri]RYU96771.1 endonuclease V [Emticicia agri]